MSLFRELKRRNVFRVAAAYLVAAWLLIEVSATLEDTLYLPDWADSLLAYFLILGFPVALFFSWAFEITPDGIKREQDVEIDPAARNAAARRLDWAVIFMVSLALTFFVLDRFVLQDRTPAQVAGTTQVDVQTPGVDITAKVAASESGKAAEIAAAIPALSIAVLPFVNMSSDPEQEYFSDGLSEELLNLLADIEQLKVAARTSSFYYKNKTEEIPFTEIGRQLGVAHLLEGSVRRDGNQVRVTAQLIKVEDGFHLWSETWDRELSSIFAIQDEIAAAVVDELKIQLLGEAPHATVVDTESWELTQQARFLWKRRDEGDWERAFELFKRAVELDPENADAWLGVSPLYAYVQDPPDEDAMVHALHRAMELDPSNAEARARYALYFRWTGADERAREEMQRALAINPEDPFTLGMMSGFAAEDGDPALALEYLKRAVAADPLYILNLVSLVNLLLQQGDIEAAERQALELMKIHPDGFHAKTVLANVRLHQGRGEEALALARQLPGEPLRSTTGVMRLGYMARAYHVMGDQAGFDRTMNEYEETWGDRFPGDIASLYARAGQIDLAFEWLGRIVERDPLVARDLIRDNEFDALQDDPRWDALMASSESR